MSWIELNSSVMRGMAVAIIVRSFWRVNSTCSLALYGETYQCDKKNRQIQANDNRPEPEGLWLEILFGIFIFVDRLDWLSPLGWGHLFGRVHRSCGRHCQSRKSECSSRLRFVLP